MSRKPALSPLAAKLDQLNITIEECATVCGVPLEVITGFIENGPDAEGAIRLRWLDDDADAQRRVEQARRTVITNLEGDGAKYAGIKSPPYGGGHTGLTGGAPS